MSRPTLARACARYTNRYTAEHVPAWTREPCEGNGHFYAPQFASDAEWYENTLFPGERGHFGADDDGYTSNQTWPHGKWLAQPFVKGQQAVPAVQEAKPAPKARKFKHAFVAGLKPLYILHISEAAELAGYGPLHRLEFTNYRAAQNVANFVKAAMANKVGAE